MQRSNAYRVIGVALAAASLSACSYNKFVEQEQAIKIEWAEVQKDLQQRNDLIPGLVGALKNQVSPQEQPVIQALADSHTRFAAARTSEETIRAANRQSTALARLMALVENEPPLKANDSVQQVMKDLKDAELRVAVERMNYNARVQLYNTSRREFPGGLMAGVLNFPDYPFFEVPPADSTK